MKRESKSPHELSVEYENRRRRKVPFKDAYNPAELWSEVDLGFLAGYRAARRQGKKGGRK